MSKRQLQTVFLDQVENQLESQLKEVISVFQNLPEEVLLHPGFENGWSIAQCFVHLNSYADFYLLRLSRALDKAPPTKADAVFKHSLLGRYFINSMDPDRSKRKFKAIKKHLPGEVLDAHAVVAAFISHLEKLLVLTRLAKDKVLNKNSVSTSIATMLRINVGDTLVFLVVHNRRHLAQARQLLDN